MKTIEKTLRHFGAEHNRGRMNFYQIRKNVVLLDYAHNPPALGAMVQIVDQFSRYKKIAILGLPGDRENELICKSARIVAEHFDEIIIREDEDLRGRRSGEVPDLIRQTAQKYNPGVVCQCISSEKEAIKTALETQKSEPQMVTIFYDNIDYALAALRDFDPVPIQNLNEFLETEQTNEIAGSQNKSVRELLA